MFKFFRGLKSKIALKPIIDDQILFETDTNTLLFDDGTNRKHVKDPSAGKSLSFSDHVLSLKDSDNNVISSVNISTPTIFYVDISTGHLLYQTADDITLTGDVIIPGDLTVNGSVTVTSS